MPMLCPIRVLISSRQVMSKKSVAVLCDEAAKIPDRSSLIEELFRLIQDETHIFK